MVWSLALCPGDTKQDSAVYGAEFGVVFLAKGPRTASIQEGLDFKYHVGEKSTVILYTYITLIAMQRHQIKSKNKTETM